ncbi:MAG: heavy-metal-associated domain-containing protein, partial [Alistipes sp.]
MKKILLVCLMTVMGLGICSAQRQSGKKSTVSTVVFAAEIDCDHCVSKIMNNIPSLGKGVKDVKTDLKTKEVTVLFDASKNDVANIAKGLESLKVNVTPKTLDGKVLAYDAALG